MHIQGCLCVYVSVEYCLFQSSIYPDHVMSPLTRFPCGRHLDTSTVCLITFGCSSFRGRKRNSTWTPMVCLSPARQLQPSPVCSLSLTTCRTAKAKAARSDLLTQLCPHLMSPFIQSPCGLSWTFSLGFFISFHPARKRKCVCLMTGTHSSLRRPLKATPPHLINAPKYVHQHVSVHLVFSVTVVSISICAHFVSTD